MLKNIIKTKNNTGSSWILTLTFLFTLVLFGVFLTGNKVQAACNSGCQSVANSLGWSTTCSTYSRYCGTCSQCQTCTPVNGGWSSATCTNWSTCTRTCGTGTQTRTCTRTCTNPSPSCGGSNCTGSSSWSESQYCNTQSCCSDDGRTCNYSDSCDTTGTNNCGTEVSRCNRTTAVNGGWSGCSTSCGTGTRTCNNPSPSCGGSNCSGSTSCSVYSYSWDTGNWSGCDSGTCQQTRTVNCKRCDGQVVSDQACSGTKPSTTQSCVINGTWTGACTVSCGGGTKTCAGAACGGSCQPPAPSCNTQSCAVNGVCGDAAKNYSASDTNYSGSFCSSGTASPSSPTFPATGGSTSWTCNGSNGGTNASCAAYRAPSAPSLSVNPSPVTSGNDATFSWNAPSGATSYALKFYRDNAWDSNYTWVWSTSRAINTAGLNSTIGALVWACSNNACSSASNYAGSNIVFAVNGACGSAATNYSFNTNSWIGSFCSVGSPSPSSPSFPAPGDSTTWTCSGSNGGSDASCRGSRAPVAVTLAVNNGRVAAGTNVVFSWNAPNGATSYALKYYRDTTWDANYTWVYTNNATVSTNNLNSVIGAYVWPCSNYACGNQSNYAAAEIVPASPNIPTLSVSPTQNVIPGDNVYFSWNEVPWATNYKIGYRRDGLWDTSWTPVDTGGPSVYFTTTNLYQSIGAEVIACHEFGCSDRSNQAIATMLPRPAASAITVATPPSVINNGTYAVYIGGRYNYVLWNWTAVTGLTEYRVSVQKNNGTWSADSVINKNTTNYQITLDPDLRGVNKIAARVKACNQSGCSNWATSQDITITLAPPSEIPSVQSLSTSSNTNSTNISSNSDPIYKAITNSAASPTVYRIEILDNSVGATFSIVDGNGNVITQDVRSFTNEMFMKVPAGVTYYLKIVSSNAGQVQYRFKRYSIYPPYQGQ